jgi:hypothetical protein
MYGRAPHRLPYASFRLSVAFVYLRPDTDASNSGWTDQAGGTTNLYLTVDEAAPANDADYVKSSLNPTADVIRFRISDPSSAIAGPFSVSYRYGIVGSGVLTITASLKQGTTLIRSWVHTDATTTFKTVTQTLSSGEFASITDFTDLFMEFQAGP